MTKHTMVKFTLHRKGVILIAVLCVVLAVLLVVVGYIAGSQHARTKSATAVAPPAPAPAATATTATAAATPAPPPESFALRVGIAASEEEANEAVKHFKAKKVAAIVVPAELHDGTVVYEIHAGPYAGRQQALAAADALKNDGIHSDLVPAP